MTQSFPTQIGQKVFGHCKTLNRIQTVVHPVAYHTNHNLLICAPTGAGKTNIALLTVVHQIRKHVESGVIQTDKFKVRWRGGGRDWGVNDEWKDC